MPTLEQYRNKRDFVQSSEPRGRVGRKKSGRSFVVQKHDARALHYDFRLELGGVLLSWAVPKGPSLDPHVKRLAVETEPHPVEYGTFEGTIPEAHYGAGTVMVWDQGTWLPEGDAQRAYQKGHLSFTLSGQKLRGRWHLVRTPRASGKQPSWLLFKSKDEFAAPGDTQVVDASPDSAASGRTLSEIAEGNPGGAKLRRAPKKGTPTKGKARGPRQAAKVPPTRQAAKVPPTRQPAEAPPPREVSPELATLVDRAPEGNAWLHEVKFDGYRLLAHIDGSEIRLLTRNGKDWTDRLPTVAAAFQALKLKTAVFDGELVWLDERGISNFQGLQNAMSAKESGALVYYAFDLLYLNGESLTGNSLLQRKAALLRVLSRLGHAEDHIRVSEHVVGGGAAFFASARDLGLEGIVSKRVDSVYRPGRGKDWLKVKCGSRQEFVIVGYTDPGGSRSHFGALLLGVRRQGKLVYVGRVGTGFSDRSLREISEKLEPLRAHQAPLEHPLHGAELREVHWVEPSLVAEVSFTELTRDGLLRHPSFLGLREDKPTADVKLEVSEPVDAAADAADTSARSASLTRDYPLTHPEKVLYPRLGITKRELLSYYELVAERMLPHVRNRPLTLVRCPNGCDNPCFFQKHPGRGAPEGLRSVAIREREGKSPYSVIDDVQGLFGLVQLGALEIHTWGSAADDFERPNLLVFDLDPDPNLAFAEVAAAARRLRALFASVQLESFVKTTGGKGLHVCIPVAADLGWEEIKTFTQQIAQTLVRESPDKYLATASKAARSGKIFIDYLRNARGATFVAPYSTRARDGGTVAAPLEWDELDGPLDLTSFTIRGMKDRLARLPRDPFSAAATLQQRLRPEP